MTKSKKRIVSYYNKIGNNSVLSISSTTLNTKQYNEFTKYVENILEYVPNVNINYKQLTLTQYKLIQKYDNLPYEIRDMVLNVRTHNRKQKGSNERNIQHLSYLLNNMFKEKTLPKILSKIDEFIEEISSDDIKYQLNKVYYSKLKG